MHAQFEKLYMKTIRIIIEKNQDGFWGYAENENGITGGGDTVHECKKDIIDCIETLKSFNTSNRPKFLQSPYQCCLRKNHRHPPETITTLRNRLPKTPKSTA
jgi:hypothetical protein